MFQKLPPDHSIGLILQQYLSAEKTYEDISSSCISDKICAWVTLKLTINMLSGCWRLVLGQL